VSKAEIHSKPTRTWLQRGDDPLLIAGPCSAESEQQLRQVAKTLSENQKVHLIRAGVWKPRTRPNSFEGLGAQALPWISRIQEEYGIPFTIEVAKAEHVEQALEAGIRHLWIGARTTVNPFSVQEIADALVGEDIPVFVKNPLNPDLQLWIGAFERLNKAGITKLVAIHRGFNTYQDHVFRNSPNWEIPIELKTKLPELEIIVDPSHIGGKRPLLASIAQKAFDLGFDGLMVETHPDPDNALSDPKQQVPLAEFNAFIAQLQTRREGFEDAVSIDRLQRLRDLIDEIDYILLEQLAKRNQIVKEIGEYKADSGVAIFQLERWIEILKDRQRYGDDTGLDEQLVRDIWKAIHNASIRLQTEIVQKHKLDV
jgi:chorismate mutase